MNIRTAQLEDTAALVRLWNACFKDDENFLMEFIKYRYKPYNALLAEEDGIIVSALHLVPYEILIDSQIYSASFIVAAGTLQSYRKRGLMTSLLEYVKNNFSSDFIALYPADRDFYSSRGFKTVSFTNKYELKDIPETESIIVPADTDEMNNVYNDMIINTGGGLIRDMYSWYFYLMDFKTLCVKTDTGYGYACIKDNEAKEIIASDKLTGQALLYKLYNQGVKYVRAVPDSVIDKLFEGKTSEREVLGMISPEIDSIIYISELY